jgi:NTP pyrophosphatase (non-canonical NTP hydrolase)
MITLPERASMKDYQRYIHELEALHGWLKLDLVHNCFLMGEEVGEVFKAVRRYERLAEERPSTGEAAELPAVAPLRDELGEELVDVFNFLLAIANRVGVDLEQAFREKNARNQQRSWD